jgi:CRP-like cAMP-binding protein
MQLISVAAGEIIFRAGQPSVSVYVIDHGEVSIITNDPTAPTEIVRLHDGDLFGESGVLEGRLRSANAVAVKDSTLLVTDGDAFLKAFGLDNDKALSLLKLLCRRLRNTTRRAALNAVERDEPDGSGLDDGDLPPARLHLIPDSDKLIGLLGSEMIEVRKFPFLVGNRFGGEVSAITTNRNFSVPAAADPEFSAPHFEILRRAGRYVIRDLSQRSGTIVNGTVISRFSERAVADLRDGTNSIVAGRLGSPFRFRLLIERGRMAS